MSPAQQADEHYRREHEEDVRLLKQTLCKECDHCHAWKAEFAGAHIPVGWCDFEEMPLTASDLESTQWEMCGEELL